MKRVAVYWWTSATILAGLGLVLLFLPIEVGDSYCGTALYDTSTTEPCSSAMTLRRIIVLLCGLAVFVIVLRLALAAGRNRRLTRVAACAFFVISCVATLMVANRLLQPTRSEWCGSVLNWHRTYEVELERRCDRLLAPYWRTAIAAAAVGVASFSLGIRLWVRKAPFSG